MKKVIFVICAFILFSLTFIGYAEEGYEQKPFDITLKTIPAKFKGNSVIDLYNDLSKKYPKKDEFETKADYIKRIQDGLTDDLYAFKIEQDLFPKYDAEKNTLSFSLRIRSVNNLYSDSYESLSAIDLKKVSGKKNTYEASNAYGKTVTVTEYTGTYYGIGVLNKNRLVINNYDEINLNITCPPDKAKLLKPNLGVMLICKLGMGGKLPSRTFVSFLHGKPTIDNPIEISYSEYYVFASIEYILVYNTETGEIVRKLGFTPTTSIITELETSPTIAP